MKRLFCALLAAGTVLYASAQESPAVDADILGSDAAPEYVEFTGEYSAGEISTTDEIRDIGGSLGRRMKDSLSGDAAAEPVGADEKYGAARTYGTEKPGADIFYIGGAAGVEQIKPLRMMVAGYIEEAFGIAKEESDRIAEAVCNWNTNNYSNRDYFLHYYDEAALGPFSDKTEEIGLPADYHDWPNSRILIPHQSAGTADISVLSIAKAIGQQESYAELERLSQMEAQDAAHKKCGCFPCWQCILLLIIILLLLLLLLWLWLKLRRQKKQIDELNNQVAEASAPAVVRAAPPVSAEPGYDGSSAELALIERMKEQSHGEEILLDGSYPGYYRQNVKVMFIGKNANGIDGAEYSEAMIKAYKAHAIKSKNGTMTPSAHIVHRRSLKYVYGIERDLAYKDIPKANDLADIVGDDDGFSFARINVFKTSEEGAKTADASLLQEQIAILKSDIAIGMKLDEEALAQLGTLKEEASSGSSVLYTVTDATGRTYRLINAGIYFSDPTGGDALLYNEIRDLYKKAKAL